MRFEVDDVGVRRIVGDEVAESVAWDRLQRVEIRTTSGGPWLEDVFFLLLGDDDRGVAIDSTLAQEHDLLHRLQQLPGFDHKAVIDAMGCTDDRLFTCWVSKASEA